MEDRRAALEARYPRWPGWTLASALDAVAAEHPDRPFVLTDEGTWSYDELAAWSRRLARGLVAKGVKSGQNVALLLPNSPELVALFFAIARARAVAVPISIALREREYSYIVQQSDSVALLTPEQVRDLEHDPDPALDAELARRAEEASAADDATIFYTSGTTGQPKGVMLTHDMELRSAYGSAYTRAFEDGRRILFALPLNHVFAYIEGLLATLFVGGGAIIQPRFSSVGSLEAIARHGANEALFVPTMSLAVVDAARSGSYDTSTLHSVMSAAAPAPARLWHELVELLGVEQLVTAYGMTETAAASTFTMPGDSMERLVETVGRTKLGGVAGPLVEYKVIDPFTGEDAAEGELVARGAIVSRGYYRKPEETAAVLDADGWLRSGDLGHIDEAGYVRLTGRSKELYKCGGELVMPNEVEAWLTQHPGVSQAYVVGVADERMGEIGYAYVVAAEGHQPSAEALIEHCRTGLARFKIPARVIFVEASELPLTASGKVQKFRVAVTP